VRRFESRSVFCEHTKQRGGVATEVSDGDPRVVTESLSAHRDIKVK